MLKKASDVTALGGRNRPRWGGWRRARSGRRQGGNFLPSWSRGRGL